MPLDLEPIREFVEDNMSDACTIVRPATTADRYVDPQTGKLNTANTTPVYTGKCYVSSHGWQPQNEPQGGADTDVTMFKFAIPIGAAALKLRDMITITASLRNAALVGQNFMVEDMIDSTFSISQAFLVSRTKRKPPR